MTVREVYEALLIELNKNFGTPDLLLEDFLHFLNKAIFQWQEKRYAVYDTNQQTTDDLQVLQGELELTDFTVREKGRISFLVKELPDNYFHLLNCILEYTVVSDYKCYVADSLFSIPAKRLTSDIESIITTNSWLRPKYRVPYFRVSTKGATFTTSQIEVLRLNVVTTKENWDRSVAELETQANININKIAYYEADAAYRNAQYKSVAGSQLSVTYGKLKDVPAPGSGKYDGVFKLTKVYGDYIKYPTPVNLTYEQLDDIQDNSQLMEFKLDVCYEIIKEAVLLIMLNSGNPQLQNYAQVNTSIPPGGGIQHQPAQ